MPEARSAASFAGRNPSSAGTAEGSVPSPATSRLRTSPPSSQYQVNPPSRSRTTGGWTAAPPSAGPPDTPPRPDADAPSCPCPASWPHSLPNASGCAPPAGSSGPCTARASHHNGPENAGVRNIGLHPGTRPSGLGSGPGSSFTQAAANPRAKAARRRPLDVSALSCSVNPWMERQNGDHAASLERIGVDVKGLSGTEPIRQASLPEPERAGASPETGAFRPDFTAGQTDPVRKLWKKRFSVENPGRVPV